MDLRSIVSRTTKQLKGLFSRRQGDAMVAVDVGPTAIRALHVRQDDGGLAVDGFRIVRLASGKPRTIADSFREALELRLGDEAVALSLTGPEVAIRKIELPPMSQKELRQALPWEARRHIAGLAYDALIDAQVMNGKDGTGPMDVVLVAFPRALYVEIQEACARLGVEPAFVDVSQMASMNGLLRRLPAGDAPVALLDLGSGVGSFSILSRSDLILFRDLGQRVSQMDRQLGADFGLDPAEVEIFKLSGKLPRGDAPTAAQLQRSLAEAVADLTEDLRSGLLYLESRTSRTLERAYLAGANAAFLDRHGLAETISAQSGVALERYNPFTGLRLGLIDQIGLKAVSAELSAAAGLAVRFFGST